MSDVLGAFFGGETRGPWCRVLQKPFSRHCVRGERSYIFFHSAK